MRKLIFSLTLIAIIAVLICTSLMPIFVSAETTSFDNSNVLDDLNSSTINGKPFNINDYPFDSSGIIKHPTVISFVEYCYSFKANQRNNYGLYVYFYNPQGLNIDVENLSNKIQLGISSHPDKLPTEYLKYSLKFLSKSEGAYSNLFYKFKVVNAVDLIEDLNSNTRRYDVSGIELVTKGNSTATEYSVGYTYKYSGYAKGYGVDPSEESTLTCSIMELDTISLNVTHTYYRTNASSNNQLSSVYFSVPNSILQEYDKLQKVHCSWYEYKTSPIIVTHDTTWNGISSPYYSILKNAVGKVINGHDDSIKVSFGTGYKSNSTQTVIRESYEWGYNIKEVSGGLNPVSVGKKLNQLTFLFNSGNIAPQDYTVSADELLNYIYSYNKSYVTGTLPIKNNVSKDLFMGQVESGRNEGYNEVNIDTDGADNLLSSDNSTWWDKLFGTNNDVTLSGIRPIVAISANDMLGTDEAISNRLYVNESDIDTLKSVYNKASLSDETVFILRFATTDYKSETIRNHANSNMGYVASESVFLDFDIIDLTFNKNGNYIVIPAVSSPSDVIGAITAPPQAEWLQNLWDKMKETFDKYKWIVYVVIAIVILMFISPFIPMLIKATLWIVCLPLRLIGAIFGLFKKKNKNKKE